jgi:hypothetical protein
LHGFSVANVNKACQPASQPLFINTDGRH